MQGILKSNHQKLCDSLQDIKSMQPVPNHRLMELEDDLRSVFLSYQEKMSEIKHLIHIYGEKQRSIRNEIKRAKKYTLPAPKKINHLILGKVVGLIVMSMHDDLIGMLAGTDLAPFIPF